MPESDYQRQSLPTLGRVARGLSGLFWGIPAALLVSVKSATSDWFRPWGPLMPLLAHGLIFYSLFQIAALPPERGAWRDLVDRTKLLALVNLGLAPFVYFWNARPQNVYFAYAVGLLALSAIVFLFTLNQLLRELVKLVPDHGLQPEVQWLSSLNSALLVGMVLFLGLYLGLWSIDPLPWLLVQLREFLEMSRVWLLLTFTLIPISMTMNMIWKLKDLVMKSIYTRAAIPEASGIAACPGGPVPPENHPPTTGPGGASPGAEVPNE
jgi:hypothetical protein